MSLANDCKVIRHSNAVAAGTSTITPSAGVDVSGFNSCAFLAAFGAIVSGAATSIEVHQSDDDGDADAYSALEGTKVTVADDNDNQVAVVEVLRPQKRYLKCIVNRATQNATLDGIIAVLGDAASLPTTHDSSTVVDAEVHVAPDEGTA